MITGNGITAATIIGKTRGYRKELILYSLGAQWLSGRVLDSRWRGCGLQPHSGFPHRLEKYLNLEGFLEKSLKIKSALKSTGKLLKSLEKSLNYTIFCRTKHCR